MRRFAIAAFAAYAFVIAAPAQTADIDALFGQLPGIVAHYDSKSDMGGVIALEGLTISPKKDDGTADDQNKVFIKHAELTGLDGDAILSIFDATRYGDTPDESFKTLVSHLALKEVSFFAGGKQVVFVADWALDAVEMKQFWFKPGGPGFEAQFASKGEMAAKIIGNLFDSLKVGPSTISGLHIEYEPTALAGLMVPGMPTPPSSGLASYDYGEIHGDGLDRGVFGKITVANLSGKAPMPPAGTMDLSLSDLSWDGADFSKLLPFLMKAEWPPAEREGLMHYGAACAHNYTIKVTGIGAFAFPEVCTDAIEFAWLIPLHIKADIKGTYTPAPAGEFIAPPAIAKHFTGPIDIGFLFETTYDPDAGTGALTHYKFSASEWGSFDMAFTAGGLELPGLPTLPQTYLTTLTANNATVEVVDQGGLQKILEIAADMANERSGGQGQPVTADALKAQAMMGLDMATGMLGGSAEGAAMVQAIKDFINNGGTLTVKATPPAPLHITDFATLTGKPPAEMITTLGLSATHN